MLSAVEKTKSRKGECGILGMERRLQWLGSFFPKKEMSKARLKEKGVRWIFEERLLQAKGIEYAKALR